jgi:hypothetical protein
MRVRLEKCWVDCLLRWPESGMGYQRVDLRFSNGRQLRDVAVFNAEEVELPEDLAQVRITTLERHH